MTTFETTSQIRSRGEDSVDDQVDQIDVICTAESIGIQYYEYLDEKKRACKSLRLSFSEVDELKRIADQARDITKLVEGEAHIVNKQR